MTLEVLEDEREYLYHDMTLGGNHEYHMTMENIMFAVEGHGRWRVIKMIKRQSRRQSRC